ncbi:hypothetical protein M1105_08245 [Limibaculum sp. FT325]|uniref:hypothetical protein n=1 Tax=Thermohalobaculum sediminis TaxID=2939436 RepID=UPI0020C09374|nr:hypothetical protein [Limibaculum sediminis]MCL5776971.1 hypothetical protein [Limibaculum sediminis]
MARVGALLPLAAGVLAAALAVLGAQAAACPAPSPTLVWHSCWGEARFALHLLPEDLPLPDPAPGEERVTVTGAYTARESREGGRPDPVGLFVRRGELIGRHLARMDGILIIEPDGRTARLAHRGAVPLGGAMHDLTGFEARARFLREAVASGVSLMQSHLLVVDGHSDVAEVENAPAYIRRLIVEDAAGIGLWQSRWPLTLHEAARAVVAELAPRMAMNLDMGSFDYCLREPPGAAPASCGVVAPGGAEMSKLSNLVSFAVVRAPL